MSPSSFFTNPAILPPYETAWLAGFLLLEAAVLLLAKKPYVKEKAKGWLMITGALLVACLHPIAKAAVICALLVMFVDEAYGLVAKLRGVWMKIAVSAIGTVLTAGVLAFLYFRQAEFAFLFIAVSLSDVVAYLVGTKFPIGKGFTKISPNKAFSGVLAQVAFLTMAFVLILPFRDIFVQTMLAIVLAVLAPAGDLLESAVKRAAGVKDASDAIPGHGGAYDRIDSMLLVSACYLGVFYWERIITVATAFFESGA